VGEFLVGVLLGLIVGFIGARYARRAGSAGAAPRAMPVEAEWFSRAERVEAERDRLRIGLDGAERRAAELGDQLESARRRCAELEERAGRLEQEVARLVAAAADGGPVDTTAPRPPAGLTAPDGLPDDLKMISGIGPRIEQTLNRLGIFHFRQIAALTPGNVAWLDGLLRFRGRIERERWIEQARLLATGGQTEFSRRYHRQRRQQQQHRPARP
jgi:predicted flap endonuclease-1-like 5' DNA nuclease